MQPHWTKRAVKARVKKELRSHCTALGIFARIWFADRKYSLLNKDILNDCIDKAGVYKWAYIPERFDCDDFARSVHARIVEHCAQRKDLKCPPAVGTLWGSIGGVGHAVNWALLDDKHVWLFEPQQNRYIWRPRFIDSRITYIAA